MKPRTRNILIAVGVGGAAYIWWRGRQAQAAATPPAIAPSPPAPQLDPAYVPTAVPVPVLTAPIQAVPYTTVPVAPTRFGFLAPFRAMFSTAVTAPAPSSSGTGAGSGVPSGSIRRF